jgi:hypothetical protein
MIDGMNRLRLYVGVITETNGNVFGSGAMLHKYRESGLDLDYITRYQFIYAVIDGRDAQEYEISYSEIAKHVFT